MFAGAIIEVLYKKSYAMVLRDEIARPLGLKSLALCTTDKSGGAESYVRSAEAIPRPVSSYHPSQILGNGGICTTASDLAKWNRALHGGRVLSDSSYRAMTTPRGTAATAANYGLGLYVRSTSWGARMMLHEGTTAGYAAANLWFPADSISVIVLYNGVPRVPVDVDGVIAQLVHGLTPAPRRVMAQSPPALPAAPVVTVENTPSAAAPAGAAKFVGEYEAAPGAVFTVTLDAFGSHRAHFAEDQVVAEHHARALPRLSGHGPFRATQRESCRPLLTSIMLSSAIRSISLLYGSMPALVGG